MLLLLDANFNGNIITNLSNTSHYSKYIHRTAAETRPKTFPFFLEEIP